MIVIMMVIDQTVKLKALPKIALPKLYSNGKHPDSLAFLIFQIVNASSQYRNTIYMILSCEQVPIYHFPN